VLLPIHPDGGVNGIERVLLEVDRIEELTLLVENVVLQGGALLADDLHHLADLVTFLEE